MFREDYITKDLRYCRYYEEITKEKSFILMHKYYDLVLLSDKIDVSKITIETRDRRMIELLGYWLEEIIDTCNNLNFTKEDIYLYIRLRASANQEFLEWWSDYDFQIYSFSYTKIKMEEFHNLIDMIKKDDLKEGF